MLPNMDDGRSDEIEIWKNENFSVVLASDYSSIHTLYKCTDSRLECFSNNVLVVHLLVL